MTCSPLDASPRVGQVVSLAGAPANWAVVRTGGGLPSRRLASPVWRVVRVEPQAGGWRVAVAPFRA